MISLPQLSRLALYFFLLVFTVIYQLRYPLFINFDFLIPLYCLLSLALMVSAIFLYIGVDKEKLNEKALRVLLPLDAVIISLILYKTSLQNSLYLFFYLYLIFITALSFQLRGALTISVFCAFLFSAVLFVDTSMGSNSKIFMFLMNNLAFFVVALLSGGLATQLKAKEKDLKELKNINNLIVDNIKTGLMTLDQNFTVIQSNQALKDILGHDILGKSIDTKFDIHSVVDLHSLKEDLSKKQVITKEIQYDIGDDRRHLEILISRLNLAELEAGYLLLIQDVTERRKIEDRLKNQEKLAAVGQLAAGIAHEIRNPLASMSGSVQLLATSFEQIDDEQKKLIAITLKETDRLNNLISEFLEFVRPNLPMDDKVDISKLVKDCLELLQLNKAIVTPLLDLNIQSTKPIQANRDKLKQVFLNIMINACHAMEKVESPQLKVSVELKENFIEVRIKDNGVGMEEKIRIKMFEPFFTTKPRGTGLGLAIVHKILESHNAQVDVESKVSQNGNDGGTEFIIRFKL
ncbi:MAG: ATP-binding protein [Bdellovibrionota bacterium]